MRTVPEHHIRYARAWELYKDTGLSESAKRALEREMDSAQDNFEFDEFQAFKKTLPGYCEYWNNLKAKNDDVLRFFDENI